MKEKIMINGHYVSGRMPFFTKELRDLVRTGRKTQTRRILKVARSFELDGIGMPYFNIIANDDWDVATLRRDILCPYGYAGEIRTMPEPLKAIPNPMWFDEENLAMYYADDMKPMNGMWGWSDYQISSMLMPTEYGRTLVRYTNVHVERLNDISITDAFAEGVSRADAEVYENDPREVFRFIWNQINGKKHPWSSNPWVWVIEWELIK